MADAAEHYANAERMLAGITELSPPAAMDGARLLLDAARLCVDLADLALRLDAPRPGRCPVVIPDQQDPYLPGGRCVLDAGHAHPWPGRHVLGDGQAYQFDPDTDGDPRA